MANNFFRRLVNLDSWLVGTFAFAFFDDSLRNLANFAVKKLLLLNHVLVLLILSLDALLKLLLKLTVDPI